MANSGRFPGGNQETASSEELDRLRLENQETAVLLSFLQELTSSIIRSTSVADLFRSAFTMLARRVKFHVGVGLIVEQNLDLYLIKSKNAENVVNDRLIEEIRKTLHNRIPVSFETTDIVIQADFSDLEPLGQSEDPLGHQMDTILSQEDRTAGILVLYQGEEAFSPQDRRLLEILSSQVSLVLGNIRAHERIQNLADTDPLTGIWNRRYFRRLLPIEIERARIYNLPLSLILFDVDNFKEVNDTYGHPMGDVVLSEMCGAVRETLRPVDVFARFGGDEFAIVLPHTDLPGAISVCERILQKIKMVDITTELGSRLAFSISLGISTNVPLSLGAQELIQLADEHLYVAKKSGKDQLSW